MMREAKTAALALLVAACGLSTGPGTTGDDDPQTVELGVGDEVAIPGTVLRVPFLGVEEDSRCPVDVTCVWEGNAAVELGLTASSGPTHLHVLNTALEPKAVDFNGVRVTLVGVAPQPRDGEPIPADDYVITLRLEPIEL
jgi:hypothetical protein